MAQPLSPLSPSHRNSRRLSPRSPPSTARRRGIDEILAADNDKENVSPNPAKRALYDGSCDDRDDLKYSPARETRYDDETDDFVSNPPSSPFQYDARNDTVDVATLRDEPMSSVQRSSSPKKASHDIYVDEHEEIRNGGNTANIMVDESEDPQNQEADTRNEAEDNNSVIHHQQFTENDRLDIGNSVLEERRNEGMSTVCREDESHMDSESGNDAIISGTNDAGDTSDPMDETCLSTFSDVPNADMTLFAKLRGSPTKQLQDITNSPSRASRASPYRSAEPATPGTAKRESRGRGMSDVDISPTPRKPAYGNENDTTNLLDFTDQLNYFSRVSQRYAEQNGRISSPRRRSPLKSRRESIRTPGKFSLLDFDIPPAPTPRSIPTITPREMETMKSGYLSEISSLKASLSGKEAEVASLKQAVADAERRVGEALEQVRNEAIRKEALEVEQAEWERRGKEMEAILREVRAEIVEGERERERLMKKVEESEKRKEQLEGRIVELESQLDAARRAAAEAPASASSESNARGTKTAEETAREVQDAVEKVARELHQLYKSKHETKVAALKKSYEARWEKRVREAETKLKEANEEIERLKTERDATMSGPVNPNASMIGRDSEELEAEKRVLEAQIKGLQQEMASLKRDNERLHAELKQERTEKGELVAAVDEWLAMQQAQNQQQTQQVQTSHRELSESFSTAREPSPVYQQEAPLKESDLVPPAEPETNFRRSISRGGVSGIRPPSSGLGEKKQTRPSMGMYAHGHGPSGHARTNSSGRTGIAVPTTTPGRSGIMSSIERMGRGGN
ncbi:hypothetical protein VTN77DRAFT_3533 [Rasamsonia byssochlamydoides]|uniref:uncharacterized protein n=1 Tax=Rasamsonia byssochlamydoides TaxID=89139 RepID=UPI00374411C6